MPSVSQIVRDIRRSLSALDGSLARLGASLEGAGKTPADAPARRRKAPGKRPKALKLSPKRRAALKLQGQYMGYMRQLKPKQKAMVKALKEQKGFEVAIRKAKGLAGR